MSGLKADFTLYYKIMQSLTPGLTDRYFHLSVHSRQIPLTECRSDLPSQLPFLALYPKLAQTSVSPAPLQKYAGEAHPEHPH